MKFTEIKKKFLDYFREKENGAMSINTKETTQRGCYTNRELSWLKFNERVIDEADDEKVPLCERLTFVSIFNSNLDEFYMVRVGSLYDQMLLAKKNKQEMTTGFDNKSMMTAEQQLDAVFTHTRELLHKKDKIYTHTY